MPQNDLDLLEKEDVKIARPKKYQVVLLNDDFTPFEFVVAVLVQYFNMGMDQAESVMFQAHTTGKGLCGVYPKDVAETKVKEAMDLAKVEGHPLMLVVEAQE